MHQAPAARKRGGLGLPFEGIRVLGLEHFISGPYATMMLADGGAEVIKIERPGTGDPRRHYDPLITRDGRSMSGGFMSYNRNKKSVSLDWHTEEGKAILLDLIARSDVVVENLKPGAMERRGLGWEVLHARNPRLIYAAISGFGRDPERRGPYSEWPAFDSVIQGMSGLMHLTGAEDGPPTSTIMGLADIYSGVMACYGVAAALYQRERSGEGQFLDIAMYDALASLIERPLMIYAFTGEVMNRGIDRYAPVAVFRVADGYVSTVIPTDEIWRRFCGAIGREELLRDERLDTVLKRSAEIDTLIRPAFEAWAREMTRSEVCERLMSQGMPIGPVQSPEEVYNSPQLAARGLMVEIDDPVAGKKCLPRTPVTFGAPPAMADPPPELGENNREVLVELLGLPESEVIRLAAAGVV